jgi:hypothetical protein
MIVIATLLCLMLVTRARVTWYLVLDHYCFIIDNGLCIDLRGVLPADV